MFLGVTLPGYLALRIERLATACISPTVIVLSLKTLLYVIAEKIVAGLEGARINTTVIAAGILPCRPVSPVC